MKRIMRDIVQVILNFRFKQIQERSSCYEESTTCSYVEHETPSI